MRAASSSSSRRMVLSVMKMRLPKRCAWLIRRCRSRMSLPAVARAREGRAADVDGVGAMVHGLDADVGIARGRQEFELVGQEGHGALWCSVFVPAPAWGPGVGRNAGNWPHATLAAQVRCPRGPLLSWGGPATKTSQPACGEAQHYRRSPEKRAPGVCARCPDAQRRFCLSFRMRTARAGPPCRTPWPVPAPPSAWCAFAAPVLTGRAAPDWPRRSGFRWPRRRFTD